MTIHQTPAEFLEADLSSPKPTPVWTERGSPSRPLLTTR